MNMKRVCCIIMLVIMFCGLRASSVADIITQAFQLEKSDINSAYKIMKDAKEEYPNDPDVLSVYGYMAGFEAKETYKLRALLVVNSALAAFERALEIDPEHKNARLWGGILKINMPSFLGKVPQGMQDLEIILEREDLTDKELMQCKFFLGMGYEKKENYPEAIRLFQEVIAMNIDDEYVRDSQMRIERHRD